MAGKKIRIGTRRSRLAIEQANLVIAALQRGFPEIITEKAFIRTEGDKVLDKPLHSGGREYLLQS